MENSIFLENESKKTEAFKSNDSLIDIINELTALLKPIQLEFQKEYKKPRFPVGFIIGSPRSGTTLFLQWLSKLNHFAYPTNVLNRFAYAPYIGAQIQNLLFNQDFDFSGEFSDINSSVNYNSNLGKSKGTLATNEFQHFFRNYMPNFDPEYLDEAAVKKVDFKGINSGLATIEKAFNKPFVLKAMMLQYNILDLFKYNPKSLFFHIKREPILNMQSIYLARKKYYNNTNIWWSVKPKEYSQLKNMDVYHQIAGQVFYTNNSIEKAFNELPSENQLTIEYENFCDNPIIFHNKIIELYESNGFKITNQYLGARNFSVSSSLKLKNEELKKFETAYKHIVNEFSGI